MADSQGLRVARFSPKPPKFYTKLDQWHFEGAPPAKNPVPGIKYTFFDRVPPKKFAFHWLYIP